MIDGRGILYNTSMGVPLIYVPNDVSIKTAILSEAHGTPTSGHLGAAKTLELVARKYF